MTEYITPEEYSKRIDELEKQHTSLLNRASNIMNEINSLAREYKASEFNIGEYIVIDYTPIKGYKNIFM